MGDRRLVLRRKEITIKDGDYAGWTFTAILNLSLGAVEKLSSQNVSDIVAGLAKVLVPPWNFVDEQGEPMPDPSVETIRELPIDLVGKIASTYFEETTSLPPR